MFCKNCGNVLNENDKFCMKCGCPVENTGYVGQDFSTDNGTAAQPTQQTVSHVKNTEQNFNQEVQPNQWTGQPNQPVQPQPKEKKPFPVKLVAIIGGAVLVVAAIVVTLIVVLNQPKSIKITEDYIKVEFEDNLLYDGFANAQFSIDYEKIDDELIPKKDTNKYENDLNSVGDWIDAIQDYDEYLLASENSFEPFIYYCDIDAYIKDSEESRKEAENYAAGAYQNVNNIGKDDVIVVKITWSDSTDDIEYMELMEKALGISLDKSDIEFEIKVSDILEDQSINLKECVTVDPVKYITENDLVKTDGIVDGGLCVKILPFEYEQDGYTVKSDGSINYGYYASYASVSVFDGESQIYSFRVNLSESEDLSDGDLITISTDEENSLSNGIIVSANNSSYTVVLNEALTVDKVKSNIDKIKEQAVKIAEEDISKLSDASVENVYFSETKDQENYSYQNALIFVIKGKYTSITETNTRYFEIRLFNTYLDGEELAYTKQSSGIGYSKKEDIQKYSSYLNDEDYKVTKIQ